MDIVKLLTDQRNKLRRQEAAITQTKEHIQLLEEALAKKAPRGS